CRYPAAPPPSTHQTLRSCARRNGCAHMATGRPDPLTPAAKALQPDTSPDVAWFTTGTATAAVAARRERDVTAAGRAPAATAAAADDARRRAQAYPARPGQDPGRRRQDGARLDAVPIRGRAGPQGSIIRSARRHLRRAVHRPC